MKYKYNDMSHQDKDIQKEKKISVLDFHIQPNMWRLDVITSI